MQLLAGQMRNNLALLANNGRPVTARKLDVAGQCGHEAMSGSERDRGATTWRPSMADLRTGSVVLRPFAADNVERYGRQAHAELAAKPKAYEHWRCPVPMLDEWLDEVRYRVADPDQRSYWILDVSTGREVLAGRTAAWRIDWDNLIVEIGMTVFEPFWARLPVLAVTD
jgi:hypothetical protein